MQFKFQQMRIRKQSGFLLLEAGLALLLASAIAIPALMQQYETLQDTKARAQAVSLMNLQGADNNYLTVHYKELVNGTAIPGIVDIYHPTIAELKGDHSLPPNFSAVPIIGGLYKTSVTLTPGGNLEGLVWINTPYLTRSGGKVDGARLGLALRQIGADSAYSSPENAAVLSGYGGQWSTPNPEGAKGGILAARTGYASASLAQFYRLDGSKALVANMNAGGNSITGVNALNATNVTLPAGNSLQIGNSYYYGDGVSSAIRQSGSAYIQHADGSSADIAQVGNVTAGGQVQAGALQSNSTLQVAGNSNVGGIATVGALQSNSTLQVAGNSNVGGIAAAGALQSNTTLQVAGNSNVGGTATVGALQSNSNIQVAGNANVGGTSTVGSQNVLTNQMVYGNTTIMQALVPGQIAVAGGSCAGNAGAIGRDANNNLFVCN